VGALATVDRLGAEHGGSEWQGTQHQHFFDGYVSWNQSIVSRRPVSKST
jgi:uncharacterized protein YukE